MKLPLLTGLALAGALLASTAAQAANARTPYRNVDKRTDMGNDTGDSQVDRLNEQQLDRNYKGPYYPATPAPSMAPPAAPPRY